MHNNWHFQEPASAAKSSDEFPATSVRIIDQHKSRCAINFLRMYIINTTELDVQTLVITHTRVSLHPMAACCIHSSSTISSAVSLIMFFRCFHPHTLWQLIPLKWNVKHSKRLRSQFQRKALNIREASEHSNVKFSSSYVIDNLKQRSLSSLLIKIHFDPLTHTLS